MDNNLNDFNVTDRQTFVKFLELLHKDLIKNPEGWENTTLAEFLESMAAYATDIQGYYDNTRQMINADEPSWQTFADILTGATIYE